MDALMQSIIEFAELEAFIDQPLEHIQAGCKRLGLSVASAVQPEILLIDEVLAVGDEDSRAKSGADQIHGARCSHGCHRFA